MYSAGFDTYLAHHESPSFQALPSCAYTCAPSVLGKISSLAWATVCDGEPAAFPARCLFRHHQGRTPELQNIHINAYAKRL